MAILVLLWGELGRPGEARAALRSCTSVLGEDHPITTELAATAARIGPPL